jgi:23S rRNA (cytidine1920-2'-O)/16S rRNA (cytidine1409-2'-O)-methyltransferase
LLVPGGDTVPLVKPQFEAGRGKVGKKGVVRDPAVWREVLGTVLAFALDTGWAVHGVIVSPIKGPAGNVEFLAHLSAGAASRPFDLDEAIERVIGQATRPSPGSPPDLG